MSSSQADLSRELQQRNTSLGVYNQHNSNNNQAIINKNEDESYSHSHEQQQPHIESLSTGTSTVSASGAATSQDVEEQNGANPYIFQDEEDEDEVDSLAAYRLKQGHVDLNLLALLQHAATLSGTNGDNNQNEEPVAEEEEASNQEIADEQESQLNTSSPRKRQHSEPADAEVSENPENLSINYSNQSNSSKKRRKQSKPVRIAPAHSRDVRPESTHSASSAGHPVSPSYPPPPASSSQPECSSGVSSASATPLHAPPPPGAAPGSIPPHMGIPHPPPFGLFGFPPGNSAAAALQMQQLLHAISCGAPPTPQMMAAIQVSMAAARGSIFNIESYCDICQKEFCNKYFLKKHKAKIHGIHDPTSGEGQQGGNQMRSPPPPRGPPPNHMLHGQFPPFPFLPMPPMLQRGVPPPPMPAQQAPPSYELPSSGEETRLENRSSSSRTPHLSLPNPRSRQQSSSHESSHSSGEKSSEHRSRTQPTRPRLDDREEGNVFKCDLCSEVFPSVILWHSHQLMAHFPRPPSTLPPRSQEQDCREPQPQENLRRSHLKDAEETTQREAEQHHQSRAESNQESISQEHDQQHGPPPNSLLSSGLLHPAHLSSILTHGSMNPLQLQQTLAALQAVQELGCIPNPHLQQHAFPGAHHGESRRISPDPFAGSMFTPKKLREMGVINADAFCDICCKEFCNKYFLRVHKLNKHGIETAEEEVKSPREARKEKKRNGSVSGLSQDGDGRERSAGLSGEFNSSNNIGGESDADSSREPSNMALVPFRPEGAEGTTFPWSDWEPGQRRIPESTRHQFMAAMNAKNNPTQQDSHRPSPPVHKEQANQRQQPEVERSLNAELQHGSINPFQLQQTLAALQAVQELGCMPNPHLQQHAFPGGHHGESRRISPDPFAGSMFTSKKLREMGVLNAEAFCYICCKEFCNKYFLRVHKLNKHGIETAEEEVKSPREPKKEKKHNGSLSGSSHNDDDCRERSAGLACGCNSNNINSGESDAESSKEPSNSAVVPFRPDGSEGGIFPWADWEPGQRRVPESTRHQFLAAMNAKSNQMQQETHQSVTPPSDHKEEANQQQKIESERQADNDEPQHPPPPLATEFRCEQCGLTFANEYFVRMHEFYAHGILVGGWRGGPEGAFGPGDRESPSGGPPGDSGRGGGDGRSPSNSSSASHSHTGGGGDGSTPKKKSSHRSGSGGRSRSHGGGSGSGTPAGFGNGLPKPPSGPIHPKVESITTIITSDGKPKVLTGRNYCNLCNKELCNKYFMKTHMLKMHKINLEEHPHEAAVVSTIGGVTCDICQKELCSKYFLKVHKQNTHAIYEDPPGPGAGLSPGGIGGLHGPNERPGMRMMRDEFGNPMEPHNGTGSCSPSLMSGMGPHHSLPPHLRQLMCMAMDSGLNLSINSGHHNNNFILNEGGV